MSAHRVPSLSALDRIAEKLRSNGIRFALGGTGMLYALGLIDQVADWDLSVDGPLERLAPVLEGFKWTKKPHSDRFASDYLISIEIDGATIELIGGFLIKMPDGGNLRVAVTVGSFWRGIPVADPKTWLEAYRAMGRESRAAVLERYLRNQETPPNPSPAAMI